MLQNLQLQPSVPSGCLWSAHILLITVFHVVLPLHRCNAEHIRIRLVHPDFLLQHHPYLSLQTSNFLLLSSNCPLVQIGQLHFLKLLQLNRHILSFLKAELHFLWSLFLFLEDN